MSHATQGSSRNALLASLPSEDAEHLASVSRLERPPPGRTLISRSAPANDIWFPHAGAIALIHTDATGRSVQTGVIGREGGAGLERLLDRVSPLPDAVVQIEGAMSVIAAGHLRSSLTERPAVRAALSRFLCGLTAQALQTVACNRLHSLPARCCRWLLTIRDRAQTDELRLTQENLATLLGGGRTRINAVLADLERGGLVKRQRGRIHLVNRTVIRSRACACCDDALKAADHSEG